MAGYVLSVEELEDLAFREEPMPSLRFFSQVLLYQSLRALYAYARQVQLLPEQGRREKQAILEQYRRFSFLEDQQEQTNGMWRIIESTAEAFAKAPTAENGQKLYEAIYGVRPERRQGAET